MRKSVVIVSFFIFNLLLLINCYAKENDEVLLIEPRGEFVAQLLKTNQKVKLVDLNGREVVGAAYSPDSSYIAFITAEENKLFKPPSSYTSMAYLWLLSRNGGNLKQLSEVKNLHRFTIADILWSQDSQSLTIRYFKEADYDIRTNTIRWDKKEVTSFFSISGSLEEYKESFITPRPLETNSFDNQWQAYFVTKYPEERYMWTKPPKTFFIIKNLKTGEERKRSSFLGIPGLTKIARDSKNNYFIFKDPESQRIYKLLVEGGMWETGTADSHSYFLDYSESPTPFLNKTKVILLPPTPNRLQLDKTDDLKAEIKEAEKVIGDKNAEQSKRERAYELFYWLLDRDPKEEVVIKHLPEIVNNLDDPNKHVKAYAALIIKKTGYQPDLDKLLALLTDQEKNVRYTAFEALGKLKVPKSVPFLIQLLSQGNDDFDRSMAAKTLGEIGDKTAIDVLLKSLLTDSSSEVRTQAAEALRFVGEYYILDSLCNKAEQEKESLTKNWINGAIGRIRHISHIHRHTDREFSYSWNGNVETFEKMVASKNVPLDTKITKLLEGINSDNNDLKNNASTSFGMLGRNEQLGVKESLINSLLTLLQSGNVNTQWAGFHSLLGIVDESSVPILYKAFQTKQDIFTKKQIIFLLAEIDTKEANAIIKEIQHSNDGALVVEVLKKREYLSQKS